MFIQLRPAILTWIVAICGLAALIVVSAGGSNAISPTKRPRVDTAPSTAAVRNSPIGTDQTPVPMPAESRGPTSKSPAHPRAVRSSHNSGATGRTATSEGSETTRRDSLIAIDLEHGDGAAKLLVRRTWLGRETLNTVFGEGWSDDNLIRLTLMDSDTIVIRRGGVGWRVGYREGDRFVTSAGENIAKEGADWKMQFASGQVARFDRQGRLLETTNTASRKRLYTYDTSGRLISVGDNADNKLTYQYDGSRVERIEGPEGLVAHFDYNQAGQLVSVIDSNRVRTDYRYDADGELTSATDQFG